ncbi:hypothetical protein AVEN_95238-1 [Araneus ventricosus]|uniref:Uncharacterized protein n=1 Tax=Araneus ventricosus TaxID=182803 RepID=A0A4Y2DHT7_ARAVE|nr:hypothetical protein AVEN_95238-1 [Araneus ventricosus]
MTTGKGASYYENFEAKPRILLDRLRADVEKWCRECHACGAEKDKTRTKGRLQRYNVAHLSKRMALDILGPLPVRQRAIDQQSNPDIRRTNVLDCFKTQFDVVSSANGWNNRVKASQLVASLRGSAAEVLQEYLLIS